MDESFVVICSYLNFLSKHSDHLIRMKWLKKVAKGFADHYRRMVMCIVMKPFNSDEIATDNLNDKVFINEVTRLNSLFDPDFKV